MIMAPRVSKFILTSHITFSVGWFGAVAVFLALAITGVNSQDNQLARAAYLAMELSGWFVIVPFCFASLLTGLVQSLGTKWGLFNHYWIIVKLVLTLAITILLLLHMQPIGYLAGIATNTPFSGGHETGLQLQLIANAGAALVVLLGIITISIYKPWGRIQYGRHKGENQVIIQEGVKENKKSWKILLIIGSVCLVLLFIIMHLLDGGMGHH